MTLRLTRLDAGIPIVTSDGRPTQQFLRIFNGALGSIEASFNTLEETTEDIEELLTTVILLNELIVEAEEAIEAAEEATATITASDSLAKSWVENFTPPVVSADNTGLVTIADHDRHYGNGDVVSVDNDTLATGQAAGTKVYIFYEDAARAGGAVTYQFSTNEAGAAQIGDVHNVGAVEIPAAGTNSGGYARPPGYGGVEP